jgi:hypothetical protein
VKKNRQNASRFNGFTQTDKAAEPLKRLGRVWSLLTCD